MPPFFSIIIPTFNSGATVSAAMESIMLQSFTDYEMIFVDGISTDNTLQLINDHKTAHPEFNITCLSEADEGIYDAMNKGIDLATGDWLYFMGSDDKLYSTHVLADIYKEIHREPVDLIYGNVTGEISKTRYIYDTLSKVLSKGIHHQSVFYKRTIFDVVGKYDLFFKVAADYHLTLKIFCDEKFKTRYTNLEIATYGESGFSSSTFDYKYFSYHYKFLSQHNSLPRIDKAEECLDNSIYCSFFLAKEKKDIGFAWQNIWYYVSQSPGLNLKFRLKTFLRMLYWTIR